MFVIGQSKFIIAATFRSIWMKQGRLVGQHLGILVNFVCDAIPLVFDCAKLFTLREQCGAQFRSIMV